MKNNTIIKLILIFFFLVFFSFIFWYFYKPTQEGNFIENLTDNNINLFPFGDNIIPEEKKENEERLKTDDEYKEYFQEKIPRLRQISQVPTAGVYFELLSKEEIINYNLGKSKEKQISLDNKISEIRYIVSKNGHIFNTHTHTIKENRISNITIPKIYQTLFFNKDNFIIRYLNKNNDIKTYSISLSKKTSEEIDRKENQNIDFDENIRKFDGVFFPNNLIQITKSPFEDKVFYLEKKENNDIVGIVSTTWAYNTEKIFDFDFQEWNIQWVSKNEILFNSMPSRKTHSISMILNLKDKTFRKISRPLLAGNALANYDFSKILYSGIFSGQYTLLIYDQKKKLRTPLNISTLVDKCVWSKNNIDVYCAVPRAPLTLDQPDAWYRGYQYFTDNIYKINTETGFSFLIYSQRSGDPKFDILDLNLDASENYLYWIDKRTNTAWSWQIYENLKIGLVNNITLGGGQKCTQNQILTQNLRIGDRDGKYSDWEKEIITDIKILQKHLTRLDFYKGSLNGILGPLTQQAIKEMQKFLGTYQDGIIGPITRGLLNNSCN